MRIHNNKRFIERRRELRQKQTPQEEILWKRLRGRKLGYRFRRQHSVGGYILDFYCFEKRLIIELDGNIHEYNKEYDQVRDTYFKDLGYAVLRIKNYEVDNNLNAVLERITLSLRLGEGAASGPAGEVD